MPDSEKDFTCNNHKHHDIETQLSPARYRCNKCKKKTIPGYSNPNHGCNPFGYLYLAPDLCNHCAITMQVCMWCIYHDKEN
jgi:hypothetical protein